MRPRKIALLLLLVGAICLPAPLYLGWAAEATAPPPKTSGIYAAEPVDPGNASDRKHLVYRHRAAVALSIHQVSARYSAGEYRAPNQTRRLLARAMQNGSATTRDPAVAADVGRIDRNYSFVYDAYGEDDDYYRLRVRENGSRVATERVTEAKFANATVERAAVRYADLSPGERRTVDEIVRSPSGVGEGYRPRVDDAFVDRLPALVWKDGTLYSLHVTGHVDDFGPGFGGFLAGLVGTAIGAVLILLSCVVYAVPWWRDRSSEEG